MADRIITVTSPSVVTNDTLIGYNNYTDQPSAGTPLGAMMTPTEAANGHTVVLTDGLVHEVTTKPVGTTNGEFSAVVSNAVEVDLAGGGTEFTLNLSPGEVNTISPNVYGNNITTPNGYDDCNVWSDESFAGAFDFEYNVEDAAAEGTCIGIATNAIERQWDNYTAGVLIATNTSVIYEASGGSITTTGVTATYQAGDKLYLRRDVSDIVTIHLNDSLLHTYPSAITGTMYFKGSCYTNATIDSSILKEPLYS